MKSDMPIGLGFQLAMNEKAMESFSNMTEEEKRQVLEAARSANSEQQMRNIVEDITKMS